MRLLLLALVLAAAPLGAQPLPQPVAARLERGGPARAPDWAWDPPKCRPRDYAGQAVAGVVAGAVYGWLMFELGIAPFSEDPPRDDRRLRRGMTRAGAAAGGVGFVKLRRDECAAERRRRQRR